MKPLLKTFLTLAAAASLAPAAQASQLVPQNLKQMIERSDVIVTGEVAKLTDGIDQGVPFTEVTLKVKGSIKREMREGSTYKFRQYGLLKNRKMPDGRTMLANRIEGMPSWRVGEKVTTFINPTTSRTGLTSPVGLAQGKLTSNGTTVANAFDNRNLFQGMSVDASVLNSTEKAMLARKSGAVEGGVLLNLVQRAVREDWIARGVMR